jgi:hypothetical protein
MKPIASPWARIALLALAAATWLGALPAAHAADPIKIGFSGSRLPRAGIRRRGYPLANCWLISLAKSGAASPALQLVGQSGGA